MTSILSKIILYAAAVAAGYYVLPLTTHYAVEAGIIAPEPAIIHQFVIGTRLAWLAGILSALFGFCLQSEWKYVFLTQPAIMPLCVSTYIITKIMYF